MNDDQRAVVRSLIELADRLLLNGQLDQAELAADAALQQARRYSGEVPGPGLREPRREPHPGFPVWKQPRP